MANNDNQVVDQKMVFISSPMKKQVPTFSGGQEEEIGDWLRKFSRWAATAGLKEEDFPKLFDEALTGEAQLWWRRIDKLAKKPFQTWDELQQMLKKRFGRPLTPSQLMQILGDLHQKPDESARAFEDRVRYSLLRFEEDLIFPAGNDRVQEIVELTKNAVFESFGKMLFLNGLPESIKEVVSNSGATSWDECVEAANRAETVKKGKVKTQRAFASVCEVTEEEKLKSMIEAIVKQQKQQGGQGNSNGGHQRRQEKWDGERGGKRPSWFKDEMMPARHCYRCAIPGHSRRNCKVEEGAMGWTALIKKYFPDKVAEVSAKGAEASQEFHADAIQDFEYL